MSLNGDPGVLEDNSFVSCRYMVELLSDRESTKGDKLGDIEVVIVSRKGINSIVRLDSPKEVMIDESPDYLVVVEFSITDNKCRAEFLVEVFKAVIAIAMEDDVSDIKLPKGVTKEHCAQIRNYIFPNIKNADKYIIATFFNDADDCFKIRLLPRYSKQKSGQRVP